MHGVVSIVGQVLVFMMGIAVFAVVVLGFENMEERFLNVGEELNGRSVSRFVAFSAMDTWLLQQAGRNASVTAYVDVPYSGGKALEVTMKNGEVCAASPYQESCKKVPLNTTLTGSAYTVQKFRLETSANGLALTGGPFG